MAVTKSARITAFQEKPADPPAMPGKPESSLMQYGHLAIFNSRPTLPPQRDLPTPDPAVDFGSGHDGPRRQRFALLAPSLCVLSVIHDPNGSPP